MLKGWEEKSIGKLGTFSKGSGVSRADSNSGKLPCIRYGEIYTTHNDYIKDFTSFISSEVAQTAKVLKRGDLLFTGSGETKEEIGKCVAFIDDFEAYAGGDIIILTPSGEVDPLFMGFMLNTPDVVKQKASKGQGDAVVHITAKALSDVTVLLPSLPAQRAIAAALSDADAYIAALEKLIAKKRNIKQGAMQELLTGKRRLPGFSGEWVEKPLSRVLKVGHGKSQHEIEIAGGKYPILATGGEIGKTNAFLYDQPSVLIGRKGTIDKPQFMDTPFWSIDTLFYTIIGESASPKYLYYLFCTIEWANLNEASGVPSLSAGIIEKLEVYLPSDKNEQAAIAEVLSDMDAEIDALAAKLNKARRIKSGMMSELLTGKIRLVENGKDHKVVVYELPEAAPFLKAAEPAAKDYNRKMGDAQSG